MNDITHCKQCGTEFEISEKDKAFYQKMDVPPPTQCSSCRMRRRLAFQNDKTLYARTSSKSGMPIISMYPENAPFPVYDHGEWYADNWDPLSYGRPIDFSRPFFDQFKELRDRVPRINLVADNRCTSSPYVNHASAVKNCHMIFASIEDEDCYYGYRINHSKNCVDNLFSHTCELCYECVETYSSYGCRYCQHIGSCTNSAFLYDCSGCTDCLCCAGLRNKSYCIFNVQYSREEYEKKIKEYRLDSHDGIKQLKKEFNTFLLAYPRKFAAIKNGEHVSGDNINNAKNCIAVFDAVKCDNVSYAQFVDDTHDSMDINYGYGSELNYDSEMTGLSAYNIRFSTNVWPNVNNLDYCDTGANISDCFGCVGLRNKQYCILNIQYGKEEYAGLRDKLIEHMKEMGEWGEFFSIEHSPFAYNESSAMMFFPMTKEEVERNGWRWQENMPGSFGKETLRAVDMPDSINDVTESVSDEMLACVQCGKNYKITKQELAFYKRTVVPMPRACFDCRHMSRIKQRNPARLYHWQCTCELEAHDHVGRCANTFETTYAPDRPEKVYCEACYQKEVS